MMHDPDPDEADEFTVRLRAQPPAELPAHWRTEILAAAASMVRSPDRPSRWRRAAGTLGAWLWPHPLAYAGLAAAWAFILAMRLATTAPQPASSLSDSWLVTTDASRVPEGGLPIFASGRFASLEASWDPNVATRP